MSKIVSHTLCRNGQPFIGEVLKAALPIVDRMIITISKRSNDGTRGVIEALNSPKIELYEEEVSNLGLLTQERQKQVDMTDKGDIIWFLDDDDFWQEEHARACIGVLQTNDFDAVSVNPYQVIGKNMQDANWISRKYFTKFFKNVDINYRHPWPRDIIFKGDQHLYWKVNRRNPRVPFKFFHLAEVKGHSFRNYELKDFKYPDVKPTSLVAELPKPIYEILNNRANI